MFPDGVKTDGLCTSFQPNPPVKIKSIRCPKCGGRDTVECLYEYTEFYREVSVKGSYRATFAWREEPGDPERVEAHCNCGHIWNLKGIKTVYQLDIEDRQ
jgi:hypothetical protein